MEVGEQTEEGCLVLAVAGRIDGKTAPQFEKAVLDAIPRSSGVLIVDCARVDFISSAGLRVFLLAVKRLKPTGRKLAVCALQPLVKEIFDTAGFTNLLPVVPDRGSALAVATRR